MVALGAGWHVDTIDLYASRSRSEFARRAEKLLGRAVDEIESDLLAVLVEAEKMAADDVEKPVEASAPAITEDERAEALVLLNGLDAPVGPVEEMTEESIAGRYSS